VTGLRGRLTAAANATGGWGYYAGKSSRLEPTCWALLALAPDAQGAAPHERFLSRCQQPSGWLVENPELPANVAFNALVAFTWCALSDLAPANARQRVWSALVGAKGIKTETPPGSAQDNALQGWPWIADTFSWLEPTAWGLLALKKARRMGLTSQAAEARIAEADRLLINRVCNPGGWNFGNANVMSQDLRPYVPTTALGLLAMQDRPAEPAVRRSLAFLEAHAEDEVSASALGLTAIALAAYDRPAAQVEARLGSALESAESFGNLHGMAIALFALTMNNRGNVFKL